MQHAHSVNLQVCEADRLSFLPYLFDSDFLRAEMQIYATADRYLSGYNGGYMAPDIDQVTLSNADNGFEKTISGDAAGIILTSLVINRRCWFHHDRGNAGMVQMYIQREDQLKAYIDTHPERADIWRALD